MLDDVPYGEMSKEQRAQFKAEFIQDYCLELGCGEAEARLMYNEYLNQEGYTGRDEQIYMRRDSRMSKDDLHNYTLHRI